jgi:hypothetical protein
VLRVLVLRVLVLRVLVLQAQFSCWRSLQAGRR